MVTYLNDLIAELPDKKTLTALDDLDEFGFPKLPDLGRRVTLKEVLEEVKKKIKTDLETLPKPEEQLSSEPPSIEKKLLDYQKAIDNLANRAESGTYIFLDNIFPIPLRRNGFRDYMDLGTGEPRYFVKYPLIKAYAQALSSWRKLLQTNYNQIFIPQECWSQAQAGRTCLEGTEKDERISKFRSGLSERKGPPFINSDLKQYLQEFAGLRDDCGQESATSPEPAGNIFYVWSADRPAYNSLISQVIDLSKKGGLKQKRNGNAHRDDAHADEILVASAAFQTIKTKSPSLIVSNDKDVDRIRQAYLKQFEQNYPHKEQLDIGFAGMPRLDD